MRHPKRGYTDSFRIIGGAHRGRRLGFPPSEGLRPTPDRVRQTLFDWLSQRIGGARVLDLFAGSGALGLEALSRGAAQAWFVERDPTAAAAIRAHLEALGQAHGSVVVGDSLQVLPTLPGPFDIVFVDPPFESTLRRRALEALAPSLAADARVYVEGPADEAPQLPSGWRVVRSKRAGNVGYHLLGVDVVGDARSTSGTIA